MCDAVVALSFQNLFTGAFGRNPDGNESTSEVYFVGQSKLPGLSYYSKWDNHDGSIGIRYWIWQESCKTFNQIDELILSDLSGVLHYIAKDLLSDSISMVEVLTSFIITLYDDTIHSGRFESSQSWALTIKFFKHISTELTNVWAKARYYVQSDDQ